MAAYALTIFTGAFLLFLVQPLIGKYILPWFGGGPGVWTTCMLFFQVLLLGGYAYAHWLTSQLRPRTQALVHLALLGAALALLPITPSDAWKPAAGHDPVSGILLLLTVSVGLPYFVLSSTGPLLQRWFSVRHPGVSPYRLYALSNAGSLLALVSYPFLVEPTLSRPTQAALWSWGMVGFALLCGYCAWGLRQAPVGATAPPIDSPNAGPVIAPPSWRRRLLWLALPAVASVLLLAMTNKLCQDVAVIPFLWVLPLSLYLLTFIISFDSPRWYSRRWFGPALLLALGWVVSVMLIGTKVPLLHQIAAYSGALFVCCMVCHGELYRLKPAPQQLTGFYLLISAGGALGGLLVAVLAPLIFSDFFELHLGLFVCAVLAAAVFLGDPTGPLHRGRAFWWAGSCFVVALICLGLALGYEAREGKKDAIVSSRNFYGTLTVFEYHEVTLDERYYLLQHGKITHGLQFLDPGANRWPTTYYGESSGVALALRHFPRQQGQRIGLVGLGTGSLAVYAKRGDYLRIYEINPAVKQLATTAFSYLKESPAKIEVAMGDARLSMEREPPQQFDVLALDAFSSDAIPAHLLTREAFAIYQRHLKPDGVIAVHISNRHLNLEPVVLRLAEHFKYQTALIDFTEDSEMPWLYSCTWILVTNNQKLLQNSRIADAMSPPKTNHPPVRLWTDDYSALFQVLD